MKIIFFIAFISSKNTLNATLKNNSFSNFFSLYEEGFIYVINENTFTFTNSSYSNISGGVSIIINFTFKF